MEAARNIKGDALIVLTQKEYDALIEDAGDAALALDGAEDRVMPADLARAVLAGTIHPLAAWRKVAGFSQTELAERASIRKATISDIEGNKIDPRASTLAALAWQLDVGISDIYEWNGHDLAAQ